MNGTRSDKASDTLATIHALMDCSRLLASMADACRQGANFTSENGATSENTRDARELLKRVHRLNAFINGEQEYLAWLAWLDTLGEDASRCARNWSHTSAAPCPLCGEVRQ